MRKTIFSVTLAVMLCVLLIAPMAMAANVPSAEQTTVPTARPTQLTFFTNKPITQATSVVVTVLPYDYGELLVTTDHTAVAGAANTTTVLLEFSNDGVNWARVTGPAVLDSNATDTTTYSVVSLAGRQARLRVSSVATSTYPFTLSASMIAR